MRKFKTIFEALGGYIQVKDNAKFDEFLECGGEWVTNEINGNNYKPSDYSEIITIKEDDRYTYYLCIGYHTIVKSHFSLKLRDTHLMRDLRK